MYKNILLITNFKKSEKRFNFKIIHRINWGSIIRIILDINIIVYQDRHINIRVLLGQCYLETMAKPCHMLLIFF